MNAAYTLVGHFVLRPAILLALFGCAAFLFDAWFLHTARSKRWMTGIALLGLAFTALALGQQQVELLGGGAIVAFDGAMQLDATALFFDWIFLAAAVVTVAVSYRFFETEREHHGEYYGFVLLAMCGMTVLAAATDLVLAFVALELVSISFYVLTGFLRRRQASSEAALKYILLGTFSSSLVAYGFSLLFGFSGSTSMDVLGKAIALGAPRDPLLIAAVVIVLAGLLFKVAAAPFHVWAPDVYDGAPTPVTAYLSVASKAAAFVLLIRLLHGPLAPLRPLWEPLLTVAALLSLFVGNIAALSQQKTKRLLAYSAISHTGYVLLGLVAGSETGYRGTLLYLAVYTSMNLGAFTVLLLLKRSGAPGEDVDDLHGLMQTNPMAALAMLLFLVSLAGIPPTAGFIGKYYIFLALLETGHIGLAIAGALFVAVSTYYYFRLVRNLFATAREGQTAFTGSLGLRVALVLTGIATLGLGLFPEPLLRWTPALLP